MCAPFTPCTALVENRPAPIPLAIAGAQAHSVKRSAAMAATGRADESSMSQCPYR